MPFGRFKGTELAGLPNDYFQWLREHVDLREPLRSAIHTESKRRRAGRRVLRAERRGRRSLHVLLPADVMAVAREIISAGYVVLAEACHPDHGTDPDPQRLRLLDLAAETIRELLEPESPPEAVNW